VIVAPARRESDTAVAHHHSCDAIPARGGQGRVPPDLSIHCENEQCVFVGVVTSTNICSTLQPPLELGHVLVIELVVSLPDQRLPLVEQRPHPPQGSQQGRLHLGFQCRIQRSQLALVWFQPREALLVRCNKPRSTSTHTPQVRLRHGHCEVHAVRSRSAEMLKSCGT
jgi:hypothetical protein